MSNSAQHFYEFGPFRLDRVERVLFRHDQPLTLTPKAFDLLLALVEHSGHVIEKEELMNTVWPETVVEESNLTHHISALRKMLGKGENGQGFIETVPRRGYRFVAEVLASNNEVVTPLTPPGSSLISPLASPLSAGKHTLPKPLAVKERIWKASFLFVGIAILIIGIWFILNGSAQKNMLTTPLAMAVIKAEPGPIKSIAILPFKQITPHKDDEYLGLGIADTLINRLSAQRQLQVRPLNAALADKNSDALVAGRAQKVDVVLEGTVQHVGNHLRVNARLLRISDGISLWTEKYDFTWQDYFATQDEIAKQIVKALTLQLSKEEQAALAKPFTSNTEALQLYLKGRYLYNRFDPSQYNSVLILFQQAIAKDPEFAWAYEGLAISYLRIAYSDPPNSRVALAQARAATLKAIKIDPQLAAAYAILSYTELDNLKAEQLCLRALELDPNNFEARSVYSLTLLAQGKFQAAEVEIKRTLALNPLPLEAFTVESTVYFYTQQFKQVIESSHRVLAVEPNYLLAHFFAGDALTQLGNYQEAIVEYKLGGAGENDDQVAAALALSGKREEALLILNNLKAIAKKTYVSSFNLARVCIALGDKEQALAWLQKADEEQIGEMRFIKVDPRFAGLHRDPRFQEILQHRNLHD